jgi:NADPH-dependent curcumin reductase CurA
MYFENVGGKMLDAVLENMNSFGRIAVSGMISQYDTDRKDGVFNLFKIISRRITIQGFLQSDYVHLWPKFMELMTEFLTADKVVYFEDFAPGLDNAPNAFCRLMSGAKIGKQIITVAEDD